MRSDLAELSHPLPRRLAGRDTAGYRSFATRIAAGEDRSGGAIRRSENRATTIDFCTNDRAEVEVIVFSFGSGVTAGIELP